MNGIARWCSNSVELKTLFFCRPVSYNNVVILSNSQKYQCFAKVSFVNVVDQIVLACCIIHFCIWLPFFQKMYTCVGEQSWYGKSSLFNFQKHRYRCVVL